MPITDVTKRSIAQKRRLFFKICFNCGAKNPIGGTDVESVMAVR